MIAVPISTAGAVSSWGMLILTSRLDVLNRLGRAMADPTRSRILLTLLEGPAYPAGLADSLGLTRQNVSNHLACLRGCGLVRSEREGRQVRYELASPRLTHALHDLVDLELHVEVHHEDLDGRR